MTPEWQTNMRLLCPFKPAIIIIIIYRTHQQQRPAIIIIFQQRNENISIPKINRSKWSVSIISYFIIIIHMAFVECSWDLILSNAAGHLAKWYALISHSATQTPLSYNIWRLLNSQVQMDLLWRMGRRSHANIFSNRAHSCGASDFRFEKVYATNKLVPTPPISNRKTNSNNNNRPSTE